MPVLRRLNRAALVPGLLLASLATSPTAHGQFMEKLKNPRIKVTVNHPPSLALKGTTRIAVADIQGECGLELADRLTAALVESRKFEVLDRTNLQAVLREHNFNFGGMVDTATASKLGEILGTAALVFGRTTRCNVTADVLQGRSKGLLGGGKTVITNRVRAYIGASLQIVELSTAKIYSARVYEGKTETSYESSTGVPETPDKDVELSKAYEDIIRQFSKTVLPWTETVELVVYDDDQWNLKVGARHVKLGDFEQAAAVFRKAVDENAGNSAADLKLLSKAYYNLGVAFMYSGRATEALPILNKSLGLRQTGITEDAITTCKKIIELEKEAQVQETRSIEMSASSRPSAGLTCASCGERLGSGAKFCPKCGRKVDAAVYCAKCGAQAAGGARFCTKCGAPLKK